jgi:ADP-ribose pyrophosphatase
MEDYEVLFRSQWLQLCRRDDWEFAKRPHCDSAVGILAITKESEIVLVEQYRRPMNASVIEIPAGLVGDEEEFAEESLAETAARELHEETGYQAKQIKLLISSPTSAGMTSETTHLFYATELERVSDGGGVAGESIKVHHVRLEDLRNWLLLQQSAGKLIDFKIHAALAAAKVDF